MTRTIGIDITSAVMQGGGIGRYTRELVGALLQADQITNYRFFSAKLPAEKSVPDGLISAENATHTPTFLTEKWLYRLWYRARVPLPVQTFTGNLDLYHSPDFVLPPVSGNIPTLLTVHDLSFVHFPHAYTPALVGYLNRVVPQSVERATHILADSAETKNDLINLWQVPSSKITVLYAGVSNHFVPQNSTNKMQAIRKKYGVDDAPYLLACGTVQPRKNYKMLIRAFAKIAADWPHNLAIAGGKGWLYDDILAEINAQGLDGRVRFLGFVDDADLPTLYSGADLFVFPSLYEGFGIPILEAMAAGVPVLSSNASCMPEVVGDAGVLIPPDDEAAWANEIHKLLLDAPKRAKLVGDGAMQMRKFSWQKAAIELLDVYENLLS